MKNKKKILVLGSEGLIGRSLCNQLESNNHETIHFDKKIGLDINEKELYYFLESKVVESDFVYFLAFDVGGSQYLARYEHTHQFISNNTQMMEKVFFLLQKHNKPFVFISSMMTKMPQSTYGILKCLGERYTKSLNGVSVRFWNVFGPEEIEEGKNHVITDFIVSAIKNKKIECKTDGSEVRQFIYSDEAAKALELIMNNYEKVKELSSNDLNCVDVSNNIWTPIDSIAYYIANDIEGTSVSFTDKKDKVQRDIMIDPNLEIIKEHLGWKEEVTLFRGINKLISIYKNKLRF